MAEDTLPPLFLQRVVSTERFSGGIGEYACNHLSTLLIGSHCLAISAALLFHTARGFCQAECEIDRLQTSYTEVPCTPEQRPSGIVHLTGCTVLVEGSTSSEFEVSQKLAPSAERFVDFVLSQRLAHDTSGPLSIGSSVSVLAMATPDRENRDMVTLGCWHGFQDCHVLRRVLVQKGVASAPAMLGKLQESVVWMYSELLALYILLLVQSVWIILWPTDAWCLYFCFCRGGCCDERLRSTLPRATMLSIFLASVIFISGWCACRFGRGIGSLVLVVLCAAFVIPAVLASSPIRSSTCQLNMDGFMPVPQNDTAEPWGSENNHINTEDPCEGQHFAPAMSIDQERQEILVKLALLLGCVTVGILIAQSVMAFLHPVTVRRG